LPFFLVSLGTAFLFTGGLHRWTFLTHPRFVEITPSAAGEESPQEKGKAKVRLAVFFYLYGSAHCTQYARTHQQVKHMGMTVLPKIRRPYAVSGIHKRRTARAVQLTCLTVTLTDVDRVYTSCNSIDASVGRVNDTTVLLVCVGRECKPRTWQK
jgi:hypothetical protein